MKSLDQRIADLEAMLDSGVTTFTVDGETTTINLDQVRKRLAELKAEKAGKQRPKIVTLDLSGAF